MAVDGVPAGINVILFAGLLLASAKEFNAGDLQAGPGVLPDKALAGGAAQAIRQHLGLTQAGATNPEVWPSISQHSPMALIPGSEEAI